MCLSTKSVHCGPAWAAVVMLVLGCSTTAHAGAWTQVRGKGLAITTITTSSADDAYDSAGARAGSRDFKKTELKSLMEYGLRNSVTLMLAPSAQIVSDNVSGSTRKARGLSSVDLAARVRFFTRRNYIFSLEPHVILPGTIDNTDNALLASNKTDFELRALYGLSGELMHKSYFIDAQAAFRRRSGSFADEWRADFSAGYSPTSRWQIIAKTSSIVSTGRFALYKAGASVVFSLTKRISLEAGTMRAIAGREVVRENAYTGGLWMRF